MIEVLKQKLAVAQQACLIEENALLANRERRKAQDEHELQVLGSKQGIVLCLEDLIRQQNEEAAREAEKLKTNIKRKGK